MEDYIFSHFNAILLLIAFVLSSIFIWKISKPQNPLPPEICGGWPVIGHLFQFSGADDIPLSRKLATLADKYGPVFTFRLGFPRILVVSSYDAVKDCLNTNDKVFATRPASLSGEYIGYNNAMLFLASYGPYWRKIRKIVLQEVLSSSRLEKLKFVRVSEIQTSINELYSLISVAGENVDFPVTGDDFPVKVNLTNWIEKLTLSLIVKMIAGKSYGRVEKGGNEEEAERFKKALKDFMYISMEFVLWDAFPIALFKWIDFQGHVKFMKKAFKDIDCVLQDWLDEHVKKRERVDFIAGDEQDFIDVMLSMMSNEDFADGYNRETTIKATALVSTLSCCYIYIAFLEITTRTILCCSTLQKCHEVHVGSFKSNAFLKDLTLVRQHRQQHTKCNPLVGCGMGRVGCWQTLWTFDVERLFPIHSWPRRTFLFLKLTYSI